MAEEFKGERGPAPESEEARKYATFKMAMTEEAKIIEEIDKLRATIPNPTQAERIIVEKYASQLDNAKEKAEQAYNEWLRAREEV